jgi:hypothetical protein
MPKFVNYGMTRNDRRLSREAKHAAKLAKRETRREARHDRPKGSGGAEVDWSLSTTAAPQQFPSAFPNTHPDVAGVGRTLSRGL